MTEPTILVNAYLTWKLTDAPDYTLTRKVSYSGRTIHPTSLQLTITLARGVPVVWRAQLHGSLLRVRDGSVGTASTHADFGAGGSEGAPPRWVADLVDPQVAYAVETLQTAVNR